MKRTFADTVTALLLAALIWSGSPVFACNDLPHDWVALASTTAGTCGVFVYQQALELFEDAIGTQASAVVLLPRLPLPGLDDLAALGPGNDHNRLSWLARPASGAVTLEVEGQVCSTTQELSYDTFLTHGPTFRVSRKEHLAGRFVALNDTQQILAIDEFQLTAVLELDFSFHAFVPLSAWLLRRVNVYDDHRKLSGTWWMGEGQPPADARLYPADASSAAILGSAAELLPANREKGGQAHDE